MLITTFIIIIIIIITVELHCRGDSGVTALGQAIADSSILRRGIAASLQHGFEHFDA